MSHFGILSIFIHVTYLCHSHFGSFWQLYFRTASHGESIFMESKIYPLTQELTDIEVLFEFIAASVQTFITARFTPNHGECFSLTTLFTQGPGFDLLG